jgi:hypothetical protein
MVAVLHAVIKEADSSVLGAADHTSTPRLSKVFAISSGMRIIQYFQPVFWSAGSGSIFPRRAKKIHKKRKNVKKFHFLEC